MDRFGEQMTVLAKGSGYSSNLRCRVDMRAVWGSAVINGGYGAVRGDLIECAGGTVVFPLLGSVDPTSFGFYWALFTGLFVSFSVAWTVKKFQNKPKE
ncbi:hypothetical protein SAMN04488057_106234 [Cyclobacterium lianum]|uniref:Uncharacterized protein n=1 Tax=Cyclobacterium lianum TaxID=388280 RepID=A0A1M7P102_9BACT|nr:hypothetical protein SAMN04488057_106234 [Cyclobacterium lianum]